MAGVGVRLRARTCGLGRQHPRIKEKEKANIRSCRLRKVQEEKRQEEGRNECGSAADRR